MIPHARRDGQADGACEEAAAAVCDHSFRHRDGMRVCQRAQFCSVLAGARLDAGGVSDGIRNANILKKAQSLGMQAANT